MELVRGNGILRLGDAIRFPAKTDKPWSFQRGYIPILTYLSSDWVIKSRINTEVNALYGLVHSEFQIIRDTIEVHMRQLMAARNFSEDNRSPLSGKQVFKVIFVTLFEYLTRFREATIKYPDLRSTAEKIAAWFEEWVTALRATPPFNDECATYNEGKKQLIINNIRVEKERVLRIIQRERVRLTHQRATTEGLLTTLLRNFNHLGSNSNLARHPKPDWESSLNNQYPRPAEISSTPTLHCDNTVSLPTARSRPYDERYIKIITAAQTSEVDRPKYGGRILDAGVLAMRFGMDQLDSWAQSQIFQLLETSPQTHKENWSQDFLIKLALHIHDSRISTYRHDIFGQIMSILSLHNSFRSPEQRESSLDACVNIYKNPTKFSIKLPALFGYVFMVLLEHGSEVWANRLNRDERLVLYAAQADLTYLSGHKDLETDWISQRIQFKSTCSPKCNPSFYDAVDSVFDLHSIPSKAYSLQSTTPGDDLYSIFHVVSARWFFAENCRKWRCGSKCGEKTLAKFDDCVERLLCGFTEKYKHYVRTA
ncbi:hypothetical protein FRC11_002379 [Ceratobasidium sp. 423]|nr:hypothetical protein FRC11_002379 [Ceratobasidium sp. 423]